MISARLRAVVLIASLAVQVMATAGVLNPDWFGYRLLPGVLCLFLAGSWLYDHHRRHGVKRRLAAYERGVLLGAGGMWLAALWYTGRWGVPSVTEVALGAFLGLLILDALALRRRHDWDDRLGDGAYALFLVHFLAIWIWPGRPDGLLGYGLLLAIAGLGAGLAYWLVERPCERLRHRWRQPQPVGGA
jgi:peptidoglycan/LPS O-acetylase OafA/YrhL